MRLAFFYYLYSIYDEWKGALVATAFIGGVACLVSWVGIQINYDDYGSDKRFREFFTTVLNYCKYPSLVSFILTLFLPSKKDLVTLSGIIMANKEITKTGKQLSELPPKLLELINQQLDHFISKGKDEKTENL
jgi:hypothetical protein